MHPSPQKALHASAESATTTEMELAVLRALCTRAGGHIQCVRLSKELAQYRWEQADHQVIYEALIGIAGSDPETLRRQLPAVTTRMGFPDIDWQRYFAPTQIPIDRLYDFVRDLRSRVTPVAEPTA